MIVCLAEFNCLPLLNKHGIYPDEFFTDFQLFKNRALVYSEPIDLLVIMAGICNFNRRRVLETVKTLQKSMDSEFTTVHSLTVLADSQIPYDGYYFFQGKLDRLYKRNGLKWSGSRTPISITVFKDLFQEKKESICYLAERDKEDDTRYIDRYKGTHRSEDDLIELIKVPVYNKAEIKKIETKKVRKDA